MSWFGEIKDIVAILPIGLSLCIAAVMLPLVLPQQNSELMVESGLHQPSSQRCYNPFAPLALLYHINQMNRRLKRVMTYPRQHSCSYKYGDVGQSQHGNIGNLTVHLWFMWKVSPQEIFLCSASITVQRVLDFWWQIDCVDELLALLVLSQF